jgi:hypothetical protein
MSWAKFLSDRFAVATSTGLIVGRRPEGRDDACPLANSWTVAIPEFTSIAA